MMTHDSEYGFRYDPMEWLKSDSSLDGAMVRTQVFCQPQDGDQDKLDAQIDEILAQQRDDGSFGGDSKETGAKLLELLEHGASYDRPEIRNAAEAILRQVHAGHNANEWYEQDGKVLSIYALHALCLLGRGDLPVVGFSLRWLAEHPESWNGPWEGCPWTPAVFWSALWAGREIADVEATVVDGLRRVVAEMNEAGCCAYNNPWGFTNAAGRIDAAEARAFIARQIPMILRGQRPDGGWGRVSPAVFRALKTHGFFDLLSQRPPLPPEWRELREVPLPEGMWFSLTWDGRNFWSFDHQTKQAVALSPADGSAVHRVGIDNCHAITWWDGALGAVGSEPKELKKVDPETGEVLQRISLAAMEAVIDPEPVAGKLLVGDGFEGSVFVIDPEGSSKPREQCLAGPLPACLAAEGEAVWHADLWAPAIIKSDLGGRLLDWGGKPFGIQGLAFDGEQLWALDGEARRICAIEKIKEPV